MKTPQRSRCVFPLSRALVAGASLCMVFLAGAADFEALVRQARSELEKDKYAAALTSAQSALALKPGDFRASYYVGMARMGLGDLDQARAAAMQSLEQAPAGEKARVQKLVDAIDATRSAAPSAVAAVSASQPIFVECKGTNRHLDNGVPAREWIEQPILRLAPNDFKKWDPRFPPARFGANRCEYPGAACTLTATGFRMVWNTKQTEANGDTSEFVSEQYIDRTNGSYKYTMTRTVKSSQTGATTVSTDVLDDGICKPRSNPETEIPRTKF